MSASAKVTRKSLIILLLIYCKNWCSDRVFYVNIADADIGSINSLHIFINKYLYFMQVKFQKKKKKKKKKVEWSANYTIFVSFLTKIIIGLPFLTKR